MGGADSPPTPRIQIVPRREVLQYKPGKPGASDLKTVPGKVLNPPTPRTLKHQLVRAWEPSKNGVGTLSPGGFLLTQQKIKKLAGGAAGAGRRRKRRWRSQTQAPKAQEATCEGKGEREEISLRQCVLRDHQIRSGMIGSGLLLHRRMWQRRRCSHSDNVGANLKNCSGIIKDEGGWHS